MKWKTLFALWSVGGGGLGLILKYWAGMVQLAHVALWLDKSKPVIFWLSYPVWRVWVDAGAFGTSDAMGTVASQEHRVPGAQVAQWSSAGCCSDPAKYLSCPPCPCCNLRCASFDACLHWPSKATVLPWWERNSSLCTTFKQGVSHSDIS